MLLFVCVPLIVLGLTLLVLNVIGLRRKSRLRTQAVRVTLGSSLLVAAGLFGMAWFFHHPATPLFARCLAGGGGVLVALAIWSFARNRAHAD